MSEAVDRILGSGGHPACSFLETGKTYEGMIVGDREVQAREFGSKELKFWTDGSPVMVAVFDIQTDERDGDEDDGIRSLYVDKKNLREAIAVAFRDGGVKRGDTVQGGVLKVQFTGYGEAQKGQANPPKTFRAKFTKGSPAAAAVMADEPEYDYGEEPFS